MRRSRSSSLSLGASMPESTEIGLPSMHNASSLLFVLTARHLGKWPFRLLTAHCVLVFIGSVHLGWHYAIDAYVGWALTLVLWFAAKPIAEWWDKRPASNDLRSTIQAYEAQKKTG